MTRTATPFVIARLAEQAVAISCRNYQLRTNLFVCTVCRFAVGTPRSSCPTNRGTHLRRRARRLGATCAGTTECAPPRSSATYRLPRRACALLAMTRTSLSHLSLRGLRSKPWQSRAGTTNCVQICSFSPSAASRSARRGRRALRTVERTFVVGRDDSARRVQELLSAHRPVHLQRIDCHVGLAPSSQ